MQHRDGAIELRLDGSAARGLEVDGTEMLGGAVIVSRLRRVLLTRVGRGRQADAAQEAQ